MITQKDRIEKMKKDIMSLSVALNHLYLKPMPTLDRIQSETQRWEEHNFPDATSGDTFVGIVEEVGELAHAHLKGEQRIREGAIIPNDGGTIMDMKIDAIGDLIIYLIHYCNLEGINFASAIIDTWDTVKKRDWIKYPIDGTTK